MEILISIVVSTLVEILKKIANKLGYEMTKKVVAGLVFVACVVGAYLYENGVITWEMVSSIVQMFLVAVGYYQVVYKKILIPAFNALVAKLNNK